MDDAAERASGDRPTRVSEEDRPHPEAAVAPGYLANHAARVFNRNVDAALRRHGLSLSLIGPILLLSWRGPMRQRDLVAGSAVKQPAMVALLDKLEGMALIERAQSPDDGRAAIVSLTDKGSRMAAIGGDALRAENARGLSGLSQEEADTLVRLLQRLIDGFEAEHKHHS
ncbi:DNA-binding transcriptional regulator, MarR family [Sphingomonas gellani]|uniref:DNA-binding transcriptional regulator, MarR family n=1 Tax=Sphingomonas gellani TaxID=1166340 RepID=A0A1H8CVY9_9SPHN|nr:MarR family winged helix-turn-helix transcriptional regulator [Sphingomonas gellani]SEM99166.1 DNA-binding transcriptional regulator, MarR family [Sphingomonas gellani]